MQVNALPELQYAGLRLRLLHRDDLYSLHAYLTLPQVYTHTSWNVQSVDDLLPMVEANEAASAESQLRLAIADETSNALVGTVGLHSVFLRDHRAEIAYDLAPQHWGRGIASAACRAMLHWGFAQQRLVRIQATALPSNAASIRVLERCGFVREGLLRNYRLVRGRTADFWMFSAVPDTAAQTRDQP